MNGVVLPVVAKKSKRRESRLISALIATAGGLLAAIPAVIFYNYLNEKIRAFTSDMDDFSNDFLYLLEKNFSKDVSPAQITDLDLI